ncbi:uncharacterized protein LOC124663189 [Lolium rigidum]|uniref:uncharacterized protein LOC124663189 n=1 Tax=Lolium rigidum TaxID=89674 RepID=UPI001F5C36F2|nr:uncharacterized protein LOC124663189 [Lolium rigidum]
MATATAPRAVEADENATPRRPVPPARSASPQRKKVLGERNSGDSRSRGEGASAQPKAATSPTPASPTGRATGAGPYDPKTNCTTPRPEFLRYDPKRSAEILIRLEREAAEDEDLLSGVTSGTEMSEPVSSGSYSGDSECDDADDEEEAVPARGRGWARRLFLLLVSAACLLCYVYCMSSSTPFPATSEESLDFVGWNGSMRGVGGHEVFSLLGPVDMMGLEDGPEAIVCRDSEDGIPLRGPGGSPSNFMAVAMMGMADACPNVPFGEFSCQIGDESSENVDVLKEDSEIGELESEAVTGGDDLEDSFGSTSTHSHDTSMEEDKLGLVHQEKRGVNSEHSMEKTMEPESVKVENNDEELHSLEYGNTAEAAKELGRMVKKLWSAVEPHLLKMLACLSVAAAFVTAMLLKYSRRSRKVHAPVSKRQIHLPALMSLQLVMGIVIR